MSARTDHGATRLENQAAEAGVTPGNRHGVRAVNGQGRAGDAKGGRAHLYERREVDRAAPALHPWERSSAEERDEAWHRDDSWSRDV